MALTPDDVVNKRFQPTKFREGYDQDEVDDFLDEVVEELRRLNKENDELRAQLAQGGAAAPAADQAPEAEVEVPAPVAVAEPAVEQPSEPVPAPEAPAPEPEVVEAPAAAAPAAAGGDATSANGLLAMAQKVHDDYVAQGASERDRLVAEAQSQSKSLVAEAETKAKNLVATAETDAEKTTKQAEETRQKTLADLESKKSTLQTQIDKLRGFERDYRSRLTSYIQGQLNDLESSPSMADEPGPLDN
ncbi:MAG: DivIVA domain-containing protein [Galactobacter sp.]